MGLAEGPGAKIRFVTLGSLQCDRSGPGAEAARQLETMRCSYQMLRIWLVIAHCPDCDALSPVSELPGGFSAQFRSPTRFEVPTESVDIGWSGPQIHPNSDPSLHLY